jgi:C-terminal processing protease CtpA/Prc
VGGDIYKAEQFAAAAQDLIKEIDQTPKCGWVLDLRSNQGGNMWPMLAGIGPVLGEGKVGGFADAVTGLEQSWTYKGGEALLAGQSIVSVIPAYELKRPMPPVAVLTSELTASSGEAVTIAFRNRPEARSFGGPTAGVPTVNTGEVLSDGAVIILTVGVMADRTGQTYEYRIMPDQQVEIDWGALGTDSDLVITAARKWLEDQPACAGR